MSTQHEQMIIADSLTFEVRNYRKKTQYSWNWSCQVCGDSATNPRKARFWVDAKEGSLVCHCFNCGYSSSFINYIKDYHPNHYERFRKDTVQANAPVVFDLDRLFTRKGIAKEDLAKLFYVDKYPDVKQWAKILVNKKIKLSRYNLDILINLHKEHHEKRIS